MRQLRFVKQGDDPDHVVLETADGAEKFLLRVDARTRDAVRTDLPRLSPSRPEPEPKIGPREIQVRVRSGESPQELAEQNEMTLERVMRFAGPVLQERVRVAEEARRARARRSTTEGQTVVFGEAVDERFTAHGINAEAVRWDARRREDGQWIITAHWLGGDAERTAEWAFHLGTRSVVPLDDTAADLLSDRPIRAVVPHAGTAPDPATAPPLAPGVVAFPAMPDAHTGPLPKIEEVFDQEAAEQAHNTRRSTSATGTTGATRAGRPAAAGTPPPVAADTCDAPPLPLELADPGGVDDDAYRTSPLPRLTNLGVASRDENEDTRAERSRIPSWDDIMLGVRRKRD